MKITGGELRGRNIRTLEGMGTRPMLSRVRKSLFDIINYRIKGTDFLDLFAGTGSVGIEALSRNANFAVFVENEPKAIKIIEQNLAAFGISGKAGVFRNDVVPWIRIAGEEKRAFDIIFIGPPYFKCLADRALEELAKTGLLKNNGTIYVQGHKKEKFVVPEKYELIENRKYGDLILVILKNKTTL